MTAEAIWDEVICDSLGDMNIFSETTSEGDAWELLSATKEKSADARAESVRGPPTYGKTSTEEVSDNGRKQEVSDPGNAESARGVGEEAGRGKESVQERLQRRIKEILRRTAVQRNEKVSAGREHGRVERKEDRSTFEDRAYSKGYRYAETHGGKTAIAFKYAPKNRWNANAKTAAETLGRMGFDVVVFEGELLTNQKGVTGVSTAGTTIRSAGKLTIFVSADLDVDGLETALHEAFHAARFGLLLKHRNEMEGIIENNVDMESDAFEMFVSDIADLYAYSEAEVSNARFADLQQVL